MKSLKAFDSFGPLLPSFLLAGFLFSPFIILLEEVSLSFAVLPPFVVVYDTLLQAILSAGAAAVLGICIALGLLWSRENWPRGVWWLRTIAILPSILPPLVIVGSSYSLFQFFDLYPRGLFAIVFFHALIYSGVLGVLFESQMQVRLGRLSQLALLDGAKFRPFFFNSLPMLYSPIFLGGFLVFAYCVTSFSIPLLTGGTGFETLEVYIFNLIRTEAMVGSATFLALLQSLFILLIGVALMKWTPNYSADPSQNVAILPSKIGLLPLMLIVMFSFVGLFPGLGLAMNQFEDNQHLLEMFWVANTNTLILGFLSFILILLSLSFVSLFYNNIYIRKLFIGYFAPSAVICGLAFFILKDQSVFSSFHLLLLGIAVVFVPSLYKLGIESKLSDLFRQSQIARLMGASTMRVYLKIVFPQLVITIVPLSILGGFWAMGDFAISGFLLSSNETLPLLIKSLMSSYRVEMANFFLILLILEAICLFTVIGGGFYVFYKKLRN